MNCFLPAAARSDQLQEQEFQIKVIQWNMYLYTYTYVRTLGSGQSQLTEAPLTAATTAEISDFELNIIFLTTVAIYRSHLHECPVVPSSYA